MADAHKKLAIPVSLFVTVIILSSISFSTKSNLSLTPVSLSSENATQGQQVYNRDNNELLATGQLQDPSATLEVEDLSRRAKINIDLWNYWNIKHYGDHKPFPGSNKRRNLIKDIDYYQLDKGLEHWEPDWFKKTNMRYVLAVRMRKIMSRCKSFAGVRNLWKRKIPHVSIRTQSLTYCSTAKAGSTFWKTAIRTLRKSKKPALQNGKSVSFTTVRNPWHRLVSTYLQKFAPDKWEIEGQKLCPFKLKGIIGFRRFVHDCVLVKWRKGIHDIHFLPSMERCDMCSGRFNYAIAVENMMPEGEYMLSALGMKNASEFLQSARDQSIRQMEADKISKYYQSYYESLKVQDIKQLQDLYAFDIYVLQYPHSPYVDFKKS